MMLLVKELAKHIVIVGDGWRYVVGLLDKGCYKAGALGDWVFKNFHIISLFMSPLGKKSQKKNPCWGCCEILDEKEEHKYMQSQMPLYKVSDLSYT
jgi:hypothetical protein